MINTGTAVKPETLMRQAGLTAEEWLNQALLATKDMQWSHDNKAIVIAAFLQAAAQDQHTMTIRYLAENGLLASLPYEEANNLPGKSF